MLSEFARPYIQASVPVLREHGATITTTFYRNLLKAHPELLNLFNMGNQAQGHQQQSLAAAVFAYAANIDNPEVLAPVISRIVHKHCSLGIKKEHYPLVGFHLLGAIKETLGEAATPELLKAWEEAYTVLANILIEEERKLYASSATKAGTFQELKVTEVVEQSTLVKSFIMKPASGHTLAKFIPGQYVSVMVTLPSGQTQIRQYSLSDSPSKQYFRISVKREEGDSTSPAGQISNWLHANIKEGDTLLVSAPFGDFTPDTSGQHHVVFLSAGVGITPMISALNHLADNKHEVEVLFAHAARNRNHHAHQKDVAHAVAKMPNLKTRTFYSDTDINDSISEDAVQGRMLLSALPTWAYDKSKVYICGPIGFMQQQWKALLEAGVPAANIHREVFGPDLLNDLL